MHMNYAVDSIILPVIRILRDLATADPYGPIAKPLDNTLYFPRTDGKHGNSINTFGGMVLLELFYNDQICAYGESPYIDPCSFNGRSFKDCTDHEYTDHIPLEFIAMLDTIHKCHISCINHNTSFISFILVASRKILTTSSDPVIVELSKQMLILGRLCKENKLREYYYQFERMARTRLVAHIRE